ncbi:MAG TPA: UXX-star (seleno)protein family 1 [Vicinamibacterales bacterium]|nr:UXX-star (seleno)protein family 1 [Vicinamibacterales bacterium]
MIEIYGKDACPYTQAARDAYEPKGAVYLNVKEDPQAMARMLEFSKGRRVVPVIVEDGNVTVGYGGT